MTDLILGDGMKDLVRIGTDADSDGVIEWVTATDGHPFWVDGGGWTDAGDLAVGDVLVSEAGSAVEVAGLAVDTRSAVVHNLTVNRLHTYYVTYGDTSVLSHNDSCPRFSGDQQALISLAKSAKRTGVNKKDAKTLVKWSREYGLPTHKPMRHPGRGGWSSKNKHINVGPVKHIRVF